ncbi:hypothetical protein TNCV_1146391 [Trichonephila clavipes]|nr:hypothetical protein TNCV_1146391 [Trichonephila clavipes]
MQSDNRVMKFPKNFKWRQEKLCPSFSITETQAEPVAEPDEISNAIEEVADLVRQVNLEVDSNVQELLDSHNQELIMHELIEMHK